MQPKVYVNKVFELRTCYSVSISVNFKDISVTQSATIADSNAEIFRTALNGRDGFVPETLERCEQVTTVTDKHKTECPSH